MLRILWLSDSPLLATGFGRVTRAVVSRLARAPGLQVACSGMGYDGWPYEKKSFPAVIYPSASGAHGQDTFERVIQEFKPDVVITLAELWMIDWMPKHPCRPRFKWIAYVPLDAAPFYSPWEPLLRDMDEVVAMSDFGQGVLQAGVPARRIHRIYHGVDTQVFRPLPERATLKQHERFRGKFVVGCVARNQPRKNIPALVEAFARLSQRIEDVHLYLHMNPCDVGYDLVTLLRRHRLEGKADISSPDLTLTQALGDAELNHLYNLFDVMALPTMGEGFGLPIIESLAAGVPVVATDCSACTELVQGRGALVRPITKLTMGTNLIEQAIIDVEDLTEQLAQLQHDPARLQRYATAGQTFARTLDWDALMPQWLQVVGLVCGLPWVDGESAEAINRSATPSKLAGLSVG